MMYEIVSGPMVWVSFALFFIGLGIQGYRFFNITKKKSRLFLKPPPSGAPKKGKKDKKRDLKGTYAMAVGTWDRLIDWLRRSMIGTHPAMTVLTVTFHFLLFLTPIFLFAHNEMIALGVIGIGLPSLPEGFTDFLTVIVMLCLAIFLFRRIFVRRVRAITSAYDYFVLLVTAAPFVTGFMAYHQIFNYQTIIIAHMIAGEAMLILIPFTRLGHALFFFLYRFFIGSEYSFGQGRRAW